MAVDSGDRELLSVRETARLLGVHENTVRNWARDGLLPSARIPGSRFHRFDARDVERLRRQRGSVISSIEEERRTIGPELIDGTQLGQWAVTRDADGGFPELVRRLLAATPEIINISIRAGDGVFAGGWDGHADSGGSTFLPSGSLWFELGTGSRPKTKADEDYEKRRAEPAGANPPEAIFVFITPRRWSGAKAWADSRRREHFFADVLALDADDLEGWLQKTPAVHYWISERLGRRPNDAEALEQWWTRFQAKTEPALPTALFLSGRSAERDRLTGFLTGDPDVITVKSDWRDDAVAFVYSAIEATDESSNHPPPLIVSSPEVWERIATYPGRGTLIPLFDDPDIAVAQQRGHHVILPAGKDQLANGNSLNLPRPHRVGAAKALEAAGVPADASYELAALARRSLPSLVRKLARDTRFARPPWSRPPDASILAPLVLVGHWQTQSETDKVLVSRMVGKPYEDIEQTLLDWHSTEDPPFVRSGTEWHLASGEEAFLVLHKALTQTQLKRWREIAVELLVEPDPTLSLPMEERPLAGIRGVRREYSSVLRRGIAEGVAMVGASEGQRMNDGLTGAHHARQVVREVLDQANTDPSGQLWRSLADVLPRLAEAAPQVFLDAIHENLDQDTPSLRSMFQDSEQGSWMYSSSPHTGLLWALESLCWSPEFLPDASRALARLEDVDPGGKLQNRPLRSLQTVLVPWVRQTAAPLAVKVGTIASICRQYPTVGWNLVNALWPRSHSSVTQPSSPRFRDWSPESRTVPLAEWLEYIKELVDASLRLAGTDPDRWGDLSERLGSLPPTDRDRLISALDGFVDSTHLDPEQRLALWERLHKEIGRHQQFASAEWSMDASVLARMRAIADRLEPADDAERFAYLFDWRPNLPEVDVNDFDAFEARLADLRTRAVEDTLAASSLDGVMRLAERSPVPRHLGLTLGMVAPDDLTSQLLVWLDAEKPALQDVASSWASYKLATGGVGWLRYALGQSAATEGNRRLLLALNAPATGEIWDVLDELDSELSELYWQRAAPFGVPAADAARAARELLDRDRPWVAIDLLAGTMHGSNDAPTSITPTLVDEVLTAGLSANPSDAQQQTLGYEIGLLLDYLDREGYNAAVLARYEFGFFRLLEDLRRPRALFAALAQEPSLFVDLASRVYRGTNDPQRSLNEEEEALGNHAWWILHNWRELPGRLDDGSVDATHLEKWVKDARLAFSESDRADIGDELIGQTLATSPEGQDGVWPAEAVRRIVETVGSRSIESGIHTGVVNDRGFTSRDVFEGGKQEWALASKYRDWAKRTATDWPRTSRVLRGLAENYEREARREDDEAAIRGDTE
jgi:excisionase family DNA binding protein